MTYRKTGGLRDTFILEENVFDFVGGDFLPAAIDKVLAAPENAQKTVIIESAKIARAIPVVHICR